MLENDVIKSLSRMIRNSTAESFDLIFNTKPYPSMMLFRGRTLVQKRLFQSHEGFDNDLDITSVLMISRN